MIATSKNQRISGNARKGTTLAEIMVAAVLITAMVSVLSTLVVRSGRISQQTRHAQLAMDELSNQMERITLLPSDQIEEAIEALAPSAEFESSIPNAKLTGELVRDSDGSRIVMNLDWQSTKPSLPSTLVGWVDPGLSLETSDLVEATE